MLTRGSAIADRPARRFLSVEMLSTVVQIMQTDCVSAWRALSATVTFYSATDIQVVLYTHRCNRLNYRKTSMRWGASYIVWHVTLKCCQQTSTATNVIDDIAYRSTSEPSSTRTTVADGHKFSPVRRLSWRLFDRSKNAIFVYSTSIQRFQSGWSHRNFTSVCGFRKLESLCYHVA